MPTTAENELLRRGTLALLDRDGTYIALKREATVPDGAGGWVTDGTPATIDSQQFTIVGNNNQIPVQTSVDGDTSAPRFTLVGRWDADIRKADKFELNGLQYSVDFVYPDRSFETRAEAVLHG